MRAWVRCLAWKGERDRKREGDRKAHIVVMDPLGVTSHGCNGSPLNPREELVMFSCQKGTEKRKRQEK